MDIMETHEQFTRRWTEAQPIIAAYLHSLVVDFQEAEDLLQEVAVILLRKFPEYTPDRPFIRWAMGIAKYEVLTTRRRHARSRISYTPELLDRISEAYEELAPELERRAAALRQCITEIQGRARELLLLRYEQSLKPGEIAKRLGIAAIAVRVMLTRTRAALRACIDRKLRTEEAR
jgi:RNA polymerase sigma-70 factor (ECF subfamily)